MEAFAAVRCYTMHTLHADFRLNSELKEYGDLSLD